MRPRPWFRLTVSHPYPLHPLNPTQPFYFITQRFARPSFSQPMLPTQPTETGSSSHPISSNSTNEAGECCGAPWSRHITHASRSLKCGSSSSKNAYAKHPRTPNICHGGVENCRKTPAAAPGTSISSMQGDKQGRQGAQHRECKKRYHCQSTRFIRQDLPHQLGLVASPERRRGHDGRSTVTPP